MGHHLFIHDGKALPMSDWDVALVRHFLIEGAGGVGDQSVASAIADWEYQGPGVWVGIDETALIDRGPVFVAAIEVVERLGKHISLDYLHEKVKLPGGRWLKAQLTAGVVARIRGLEEHLHGRT
ncbi:MAG: hypothetical protein HZA89_02505 [Verrucomicrobia bacterium]|nr:hypothetical protein [Verrucomicrobiota bacterium]